MPRHIKCSTCNGYGYISCHDCICQTCKGTGKAKCSNCTDGYKPCGLCNSTGEIPAKKLFHSYLKPCPVCEGAKKITCYFCNGVGLVTCPKCKGTGRMTSCPICNGTLKIRCSDCSGTGKIDSQWFNSITSLPIERLRFEYEKRQHKTHKLQNSINQLNSQLDELYNWYDREQRDKPWLINHPGAQPSGLNSIPRQIRSIENQISELEEEMEAIDQIISSKWK